MPVFDAIDAPPPYSDLDAANVEIRRLQRGFFEANKRVAEAQLKRAQDNRANAGTHKTLREKLARLEQALEEAQLKCKRLERELSTSKYELVVEE